MVGKGAEVHSRYTCKEIRKSLFINLQFTRELQFNLPRTKHCSKPETILSKQGVSNHGEAVLSEGGDQPSILMTLVSARDATVPYLLIRFNLVKSKIRFTPARITNARKPAPELIAVRLRRSKGHRRIELT